MAKKYQWQIYARNSECMKSFSETRIASTTSQIFRNVMHRSEDICHDQTCSGQCTISMDH